VPAEEAALETAAELAPEEFRDLDPVGPPSAAHARLGSEGLLRLRARYAEVLARISERIADPARQAELKTKAERLNPDAWVTEEEVRGALDGYETTFEELRALVGRPRRRRRRRRTDVPGGSREPSAEDHPVSADSSETPADSRPGLQEGTPSSDVTGDFVTPADDTDES
jgi:hypothetical protein